MDWSGFYAGGTVAYGGGDMEYRNPDASWAIEDETGFGALPGTTGSVGRWSMGLNLAFCNTTASRVGSATKALT